MFHLLVLLGILFFFFFKTAVTMLLHIVLFLKPNFNLML